MSASVKLNESETRDRHVMGQPRESSWLGYLMMTAALLLVPATAMATPPGWRLVWSDDFDTLDEQKWDRITSDRPTNNSKHAYLPEQVSVADGKLVITSENKPSGELPYRSGEVISKQEQRLGRWEVRAKLPTTPGMWPAIWLLATESKSRWPSGGEIDIMENKGNRPTMTSSAFHYGTNPPFQHSYVFNEQQTSQGGKLVSYPEDYHTYAVDWLEDQLRFYVDDVNYYTVYDEDVNGYLSQHTQPMRVMLNTAVGGDFLPGPDDTTVWPQRFLIDSIRVYERDGSDVVHKLRNGSFDENGGSLAGWTLFGNRTADDPNILAQPMVKRDGVAALKVFGQFVDHESYSGVSQGISVAGSQAGAGEVCDLRSSRRQPGEDRESSDAEDRVLRSVRREV